MNRFGFIWPESLSCDRFPEEFCVTENLSKYSTAFVNKSWYFVKVLRISRKYKYISIYKFVNTSD